MRNRLYLFLAALAIATLCTPPQVASAKTVEITVDAKKRYQTMSGWEITARGLELDKLGNRFSPEWHDHSDAVFDTMVNEIGVNRIRLSLRSRFENTIDYWSLFASDQISYK